jgi:hypothetical protein
VASQSLLKFTPVHLCGVGNCPYVSFSKRRNRHPGTASRGSVHPSHGHERGHLIMTHRVWDCGTAI